MYFITNTFFTGELRSKYTDYFITGFLICHSFLDFLYIGYCTIRGEIVYPV